MRKDFLNSVQVTTYPQGSIVFAEGDPSDNFMYFIISGHADVYKNLHGKREKVNTLTDNDFFGEIALVLSRSTRTATVLVTSSELKLAYFDQTIFIKESIRNPKFTHTLFREVLVRLLRIQKKIFELEDPPVLEFDSTQPIVAEHRKNALKIEKLLTNMHGIVYSRGKTIFKEEDPAKGHLYFIIEGEVMIKKKIGHHQRIMARLKPGDIFGEEVMIHDNVRWFTAEVESQAAKVVFIDKNVFTKTGALNPEFYFIIFRTFVWQMLFTEEIYYQYLEERRED